LSFAPKEKLNSEPQLTDVGVLKVIFRCVIGIFEVQRTIFMLACWAI